jgi:uncharacterized protein
MIRVVKPSPFTEAHSAEQQNINGPAPTLWLRAARRMAIMYIHLNERTNGMPIQRLDRRHGRQMPWKNGGGSTCELAIAPAGAGLDDFAWRISCARVASGGPFSRFAGIDRSLAILEGAGLELMLNGQPSQLRPGDPVLRFAGEDEAGAELLDGPVEDFNLMTRRSAWRHRLQMLRLDGAQTLSNDADILLLYCHSGRLVVQLADDDAQALGEGQGLLLEDERSDLTLSGGADALLYIAHLYRQP